MLSRKLEVSSTQAAAAFMDPLRRHLILSFVIRTRSISEVAQLSGLSLSLTHYHVQRLCRLGLLKVASVERRAGRPIRRYSACAEAFFVPDGLLPRAFGAALNRELDAALDGGADPRSGWLAYVDRNGAMRMRREPATSARRPQADFWRILDLDEPTAVELAADLERILRKYEGRRSAGKGSRRFLVRCALARRSGDGLFSGGRPAALADASDR